MINDKTTKFFSYEKGVQQGNPLSSLLFNLYINDVFETIVNQSSVTLDGNHHLYGLIYANDLIILATSMEDLQKKRA